MLIGFCGAGGTGKTTTAKAAVQLLGEGWKFEPSKNRAVFERRGLTEADQATMTPAEALDLQMEIWRVKQAQDALSHQESHNSGFNVIMDRTPLDHWAYAMYRCAPVITENLAFELRDRIHVMLQVYDLIFYFPLVTYPTSEDGLRDTNYGVRLIIDRLIAKNLQDFSVTYEYIPERSVDYRAHWIDNTIREIVEYGKG